MVSAWLSPLLEPFRAPPFAAETGSNQEMMVAMAVTVCCAVMVGGGGVARVFLPVLFLQLQPRHCPFALRHVNGGEAENYVHFTLDTPEKHKNRIFFEKTS